MNTPLPIKSVSLEGLCLARDVALEAFERIEAIYADAREQLARFDVDMPRLKVMLSGASNDGYAISDLIHQESFAGDLKREIDREAWQTLFSQTSIDRVMDNATRNEFYSKLHGATRWGKKSDLPELTPENVTATIEGMSAQAGDFFGKALEEVFRNLSWDYVTNAPMQFGGKMIVGNAYHWLSSFDGRIDCKRIEDLERILLILDKQPPATYDTGVAGMRGLELATWYDAPPTDPMKESLFKFKVYKNRNAHVLVRHDLVGEMNRIMADRHPFDLPIPR